MNSFPPVNILSQWQFDFNLRRSGNFGVDRLYYDITNASVSNGVVLESVNYFMLKFQESSEFISYFFDKLKDSLNYDTLLTVALQKEYFEVIIEDYSNLSLENYFVIIDMIESVISFEESVILHLDVSPLSIYLNSMFKKSILYVLYPQSDVNGSENGTCSYLNSQVGLFFDSKVNKKIECINYDSSHEINQPVDIISLNLNNLRLSLFLRNYGGIQGKLDSSYVRIGIPIAQYILVFGQCAGAPTDLILAGVRTRNIMYLLYSQFSHEVGKFSDDQYSMIKYTSMQDTCSERISQNDFGVTLYQ